MSYRPKESVTFGPPFRTRLPSLAYLLLAALLVAFVVVGHLSSRGTWAFRYVVEQDAHRILGARALAAIVLGSALAAVVRAGMRGVIVHPEGVETRDLLSLGWPKVRRFAWPQVDKIVLNAGKTIAIHLWDGTLELLPPVQERDALANLLEQIARARAIPVTGGRGLAALPADD